MRLKLAEYLQQSGASRKHVAAGLRMAETTLSLYLKGTYAGDNKNIDEKVKGFLIRAKEREAVLRVRPEITFVATRGAKMAFRVLRTCHLDGGMGKIVSQPGRGKTKACIEYARINKDVILITPLETCNMKSLLKSLVDITGIKTGENNDMRARGLINILKKSGRMIVVDEANKLTTKCLEILRQIHDLAGIGVVYAGTHQLQRKINGMDMEQISSRIGISTVLPGLTEADHRLILESTGVKVSAKGLKKASDLSMGSGRLLEMNLPHAHRMAAGGEIDADHFLSADKLREIA